MPGAGSFVVLALAVLFTAVFAIQVAIHRRVRRVERWEAVRAGLARAGVLRLDRAWAALEEVLPEAERMAEEPTPGHPHAADLDVVGRASLARLAGPVTSELGRAFLRRWLLEDVDTAAARARQGAVQELAPLFELRDDFATLGRLEGPTSLEGLERFFTWAEGEPTSSGRRWLATAVWLLPPLLVAGLVGYFSWGWPAWWVVPAVAHFWILRRTAGDTREAFADSALGGPPLKALVPQLDLLAEREWRDPSLSAIADRLGRGEDDARRRLRALSRLLDYVESRRNAFYAMISPILLLEIHLWMALDRWRAAHGRAAREWLEALGEWEALSALATIAHDHPHWCFPSFDADGPAQLRAKDLGHPLLPPAECVRNDVVVGPPATFLFVTGSNMSGKSTLLRALGANAVLAAAGAPVCAVGLTLPPVRVRTSMRVEDSLAAGVSLFMAELLRIKGVVDAAAEEGGGRPVLYLLDEILHGTNTAERRIAARGVLRHLLAAGAIGAVSSHDLTLADTPDLQAAARAVHFREEVGSSDEGGAGAALTFDYRLREGVATTRNALKLLEAVGLGRPELDEDSHST